MHTPCFSIAVLCLFAGTALGQGGETITVTTSADTVDFGGDRQVADLPGPDGVVSLKEAGLASDNTPGVQTIAFAVPQDEWEFQWLYPGRVVFRPFLGFRVFDTVIIDATTQTAFTGDTNPDGNEVVIWESFFMVDNVGGVIRGFDNSSIQLSGGSNNTVQNNTLTNITVFDSDNNLIGGTEPGQGNTGNTIKIDRASDNTVVGNTIQRVRVLGWVGGGQPARNNRIGGQTEAERNFITGYGTWSGEGFPSGSTVQIFDSINTIIEGNQIGTTLDGMTKGSQASTMGIALEGENHNTTIRNNRIAGILGEGRGPHYAGIRVGTAIVLGGEGDGFIVQGNTIGLDALGQPTLGSVTGISTNDFLFQPDSSAVIGGTNPGEGNEIAGHLFSGVTVNPSNTGIRISGNSIHDNDDIGIELIDAAHQFGVTPNDSLDTDTGANGLQNYPVLTLAAATATEVRLVGTLDSSPGDSFSIEFFASSVCHATGFGEGERFLGRIEVGTDGAGHAEFDVTLPAALPSGWFATATATLEPIGSTSEFSACLPITGGSCGTDFNHDGDVNTLDVLAFLNAWNAGDASADFNNDGSVNTLDVLAFLNAWNTGC